MEVYSSLLFILREKKTKWELDWEDKAGYFRLQIASVDCKDDYLLE